jgi:hypothetical protein
VFGDSESIFMRPTRFDPPDALLAKCIRGLRDASTHSCAPPASERLAASRGHATVPQPALPASLGDDLKFVFITSAIT